MSRPLRWDIEGRDWPHREAARVIETRGMAWHVLDMGTGPTLLLLHGTGASTHSWRGMIEPLANRFRVIALDLPGHGFTRGRPSGGMGLAGVARAVSQLLEAKSIEPAMLAGHSAGAAIALEISRNGRPIPVAGFNPAILPFQGAAAQLFPALAKMLFVNPLAPRIFTAMIRSPQDARKFLERATNSQIDEAGLRCYARLLGNRHHAEGALAMMANWDLVAFEKVLPGIDAPVLLIHSDEDNAVPLASVEKAAALLPDAMLEVSPGLGHLAHEQAPDRYAARLIEWARKLDILAAKEATV